MKRGDIEAAARNVCAGYALLELYDVELSPIEATITADQWERHCCRMGFLIESLGPHVRALSQGVWGETDYVDDIVSCQPAKPEPEPVEAPQPERRPLWLELERLGLPEIIAGSTTLSTRSCRCCATPIAAVAASAARTK
jgi:hypothetical protein